MLKRVLTRVEEILRGVTSAFGAEYQFDTSTLPAVVNDPAVRGAGEGGAARCSGRTTWARRARPAADDMSVFPEAAPGAYFMLGGGNVARGITWPHHHPKFDFDEACLPIGIELGCGSSKR